MKQVPYTVCRTVKETAFKQVPVTVCKMVRETAVKRVPVHRLPDGLRDDGQAGARHDLPDGLPRPRPARSPSPPAGRSYETCVKKVCETALRDRLRDQDPLRPRDRLRDADDPVREEGLRDRSASRSRCTTTICEPVTVTRKITECEDRSACPGP